MNSIISQDAIETKIWTIRGKRVMLDFDLATLYEVQTGALKRAVRRNAERFPDDFMFELNKIEYDSLRSQFGILKRGEHSKYMPFAFTEQGVAMLSGVLNSQRAIIVNIQIMRAFVRIKNVVADNSDLRKAIATIEKRLNVHDRQIQIAFDALKSLLHPKPAAPAQIEIKKHYSPDGGKKMGFTKAKREN